MTTGLLTSGVASGGVYDSLLLLATVANGGAWRHSRRPQRGVRQSA